MATPRVALAGGKETRQRRWAGFQDSQALGVGALEFIKKLSYNEGVPISPGTQERVCMQMPGTWARCSKGYPRLWGLSPRAQPQLTPTCRAGL